MHSSVCTGGLFAITAAIADQAAYQSNETGPMSYGAIGYLSCKSTTSTDVRSTQEPGCENATACISRVSAAVKNTLFTHLAVFADIETSQFSLEIPTPYFSSTKQLARAGPLYEQAILHARSLEKLE